MQVDWEKETKKEPETTVSEKALSLGLSKEQYEKLSEFQVRQVGQLDQESLEAMMVGYLINDPDIKNKQLTDTRNAELLLNSGIKGEKFENKTFGILFNDLISYYKTTRRTLTRDEAGQYVVSLGYTHDQSIMYQSVISTCQGALISRRISVDILISRMKRFVLIKQAEKIVQEFSKQKNDPNIGIEKAIDNLRAGVNKKLVLNENSIIREFDWVDDCEKDVSWMMDMKRNPDKYRGCLCGISAIDKKTTGFRRGHLTVFVGKHGGYKSTVMMNVGYGLWEAGFNVLYASLEMEAHLVKGKLWCRGTKTVPWSRVYRGIITSPDDWGEFEYLSQKLKDNTINPDEKKKMQEKVNLLEEALFKNQTYKVEKGKEDTTRIKEFAAKIKGRPNHFKIINVGQSQKIRTSQIEQYIEENLENFKPDVVIIDYLALVASDTPYPDRRDLEVGDCCKYFRKMGERLGFSVVTAAQFKRSAIERIRKYGFTNPEKASLGTDDIAESNQIGADADTVLMLWAEDGGNRLRVFTAKARHNIEDVDKGEVVGVRQDICMVADDIGDTVVVADDISMSEGIEAARRLAEGKKLSGDLPEEGWADESLTSAVGIDDFLQDEDDLGI